MLTDDVVSLNKTSMNRNMSSGIGHCAHSQSITVAYVLFYCCLASLVACRAR